MNALYVALGVIALLLAIIGVVVPVLPTTPFVLVSVYAFARGSDRLSAWLEGTWLYRKFATKQLSKRHKWSINLAVDALLIVYLFHFDTLALRLILVALIILKHVVFHYFVPTKDDKHV